MTIAFLACSVRLGYNASQNVILSFYVPSNASYGFVSTVTVTVGGLDVTTINNFYLCTLTVVSEVSYRIILKCNFESNH